MTAQLSVPEDIIESLMAETELDQPHLLFNTLTGIFEGGMESLPTPAMTAAPPTFPQKPKEKIWKIQDHNQHFLEYLKKSLDQSDYRVKNRLFSKFKSDIKRDFSNITSELSHLSEEQIIKNFNKISALAEDKKREGLRLTETVKMRKVEEDFIAINSLFPYSGKFKGWALPEYLLMDENKQEHKFPGLYLTLNLEKDYASVGMRILWDNNVVNFSRTEGIRHPHPHVEDDGQICLGELEAAAQLLWEKQDYMGLVFMINELLATYNPESPYVRLVEWNGIATTNCHNCGARVYFDGHGSFADNRQVMMPECDACDRCTVYSNYHNCALWKNEAIFSETLNAYISKMDSFKIYRIGGVDYIPREIIKEHARGCSRCGVLTVFEDFKSEEAKVCKKCDLKEMRTGTT